MPTEVRFDEILRTLSRHDVDFILVGGVAAILQGSPLTTDDVDIVYSSSEENIARLVSALSELEASYLDPAGRHIEPNASRLSSMRVHLLKTKCGRVDALRTRGNDLAFVDLIDKTRVLEIADFEVSTLQLETLIETKEHADRPKDHYQLPFLRQLLAEIRSRDAE